MIAQLLLAAISVSAFPAATNDHGAPLVPHLTQSGPSRNTTRSANRLIGGIMTYVTWPDHIPVTDRDICVVGLPRLAVPIYPDLPGNAVMTVAYRNVRDVIGSNDCDAVFLGQLPIADRQRLMSWVSGKPVLTLTDQDPNCSFGAMVCLVQRPSNLSFSVNLDAIGRGPLRVDPRVLRIGKDGY